MATEQHILDFEGHPSYRVTWEACDSVIKFEVYRIQSTLFDGTICEEEKCLDNHVRWDGCSNVDYCGESVMAHFCGVTDLHRFCSMQVWMYAKAAELFMQKPDSYAADNLDEFFLVVPPGCGEEGFSVGVSLAEGLYRWYV